MTDPSNAPSPRPQKPRLNCGSGAWDCHIHLLGPKSLYGTVPHAPYEAPDALPEDYLALQKVLGLGKAVIVQTMVQGHDHRCLLDALRRFPGRFRGIATPRPGTANTELTAMDKLGVRGIRMVVSTGLAGIDAPHKPTFDAPLIARAAEIGWHLQVVADTTKLVYLKDTLLSLPLDVVIDHAGLPNVELGVNDPGFRSLLALLDSGRCWVKLSGPMRFSQQHALPYKDTLPFYQTLVGHAPERLVWGSDWPHVNYPQANIPSDDDLLDLMLEWAPDAATRNQILTVNPGILYK